MGVELRERWGRQPAWARCALAVHLIGFLVGTRTHVADVARDGVHAYAMFPQVPLQVFFISLVVLDPLVIVLVVLVRRGGIWLAGAVMVLDLCGNWWGNWHWFHDDPSKLLVLVPLTLFGVFVVASVAPLQRVVAGTTGASETALPSA
ncbi:hypothetical protein AB0J38_16850 [Streptomyces sp. NPDC050095]|uniref:hypothetical protein n=1 Tax=unclassified Streptomyces TaxID=2593676 RepID=UPI003415C0CE